MATRIYQTNHFEVGESITLSKEAAHHIAQVLRMQVGESLILFNNTGFDFICRIQNIKKNETQVTIEKKTFNQSESPLHLHLCQALVRNEKMDFIIQKAVELGASEFTPIETAHCQVHLSKEKQSKKYAHWQGIIEHATAQCGRAVLMKLNPPLDFKTWCESSDMFSFCLHPESPLPLKSLDLKQPEKNSLRFIIGPEGGLSELEISMAKTANIISYQFGPRILRTETAGLAVLAYLQTTFGN